MHPIRPAGSRTDRVFMRISGSVNWDHWENDSWREGEREGCVTELPECDWVCVSCHWSFCQLWLTSRKDVLHPLWCQLRPLIDCWWQLLCVWLLIVAGCMNEGQTLMLIFCAEFSKKKKKKFIPPKQNTDPSLILLFPSTLVGMWNMKTQPLVACERLTEESQPLTGLCPKDARQSLLSQPGADILMLRLQLVSLGSSACCPMSKLS